MKALFISCALLLSAFSTFAQGYQFTEVVTVPATPVKNQAATGTCWCFATTSFMESELLRMGKGEYDLSEMFIVRQKYMNQLQDNYLRRGGYPDAPNQPAFPSVLIDSSNKYSHITEYRFKTM